MTFKEAYTTAMNRSKGFEIWDATVKRCATEGRASGCMLFTIEGTGETFYYGFDGVELHQGKHNKKRARYLLDKDLVAIY